MFILRQRTQMAEMVDSLCVLRLPAWPWPGSSSVVAGRTPLEEKGKAAGEVFPGLYLSPYLHFASPNISQPTGVISIHEIACLSSLRYFFLLFIKIISFSIIETTHFIPEFWS